MHGPEMTDKKIIVCFRETSTSGESVRIFSWGMLARFAPSWQKVLIWFSWKDVFFGGGGFPSLLCKRSNVSGATSKIQGAYKSREYLYRDRPLSEVLSWSWPWDLLASSARASRFVEEPKAGGGCMLERGNINVKTKATQKRFNSRCCST